jgi:Flp pilus assembly pilin Flp
MPSDITSPATLTGSEQGTVAVEYLILVSFVGLVVASGIIALGLPLLHQYRYMQLVVATPVT